MQRKEWVEFPRDFRASQENRFIRNLNCIF
jgi:hypothetical protein